MKEEQLDKLITGYFDRGKQSFEMQLCEISRQERIENEPAVCASLLGSAHLLAMTRIQWADQTGQDERVLANETVRPRTSLSLSLQHFVKVQCRVRTSRG